jgi:hypothetical protein
MSRNRVERLDLKTLDRVEVNAIHLHFFPVLMYNLARVMLFRMAKGLLHS